jgi:glycosyltransferase
MNKGIALATGEVVGILNSDDLYESNETIELIMDKFIEKGVDSVYGDLDYVDAKDINKVLRKWRTSEYQTGGFIKGWHPPHPAFFVKKDIYNKYGVFDTTFDISADFELMLRFIEKNKISTYYLPKVVVKMREGGESNQSIKNILIGQKNIRRAFKKNDIKVSKFYTPLRLMKKAIQRIKK